MSLAHDEDEGSGRGRMLRIAGGVAALVVVAVVVWRMASSSTGVKRDIAPPPTILLTPPPPPPPPPPVKPTPEPTKSTPDPTPTPTPSPSPKAPAPPQALTQAAAAQAGSDAFNVQAGQGGGQTIGGGSGPGGRGTGVGGDFAEANYVRYLNALMQDALRRDDRISRQLFVADVAVWIDGGGRIERVQMLKTTGDGKLDRTLVAAMQALPRFEEPPPPSLKFPQRVTVRGRRA